MTTLNVVLNDQTLIAAEKVKLASGDIDSVFLNVEFDAAWDEFPHRTASFFTSRNATPIEKLLTDDQCIVPADVLAKSCTMYVGIIGVSEDGSTVKTSDNVRFKIVQGANHSQTTISPKLNLYQQYLEAVKKAVSPAQEVLLARLEKRIKEHEVEIGEEYARFKGALVEMIQPVTAWENDDVSNHKWHEPGDGEIVVNVDLSKYSSFLVVFYAKGFYDSNNVDHVFSTLVGSPMIAEKGVTYSVEVRDGGNGIVSRTFTLNDDGAVFSKPHIGWSLIPAKIIGFGV